MAQQFCEKCKKRIVIFRRIRKRGRFNGRLVNLSDKHFSLCVRHARELYQSQMQAQKFKPVLSYGQQRRLEQIYSEV